MQKLAAMTGGDKAVNRVLIENLHGIYADADTRKMLESMRQALTDTARDRNLELSAGRLDLSGELGRGRLGLREDAYDFEKDQRSTAEALGWGNIGLSALRGYGDMWYKNKLAKDLQGLRGLYPQSR